MDDVPMIANLRGLMEVADRRPDASAEAWNARRDAEHVLRAWRLWLPGLLELVGQGDPLRQDDQSAVVRAIISAYHTTRPAGTDLAIHVMDDPAVKAAFQRLNRLAALSLPSPTEEETGEPDLTLMPQVEADDYYVNALVSESTLIFHGSNYFPSGRVARVSATVCVADALRPAGLVRAGRGCAEGDRRSSTYRPADTPQHPAPISRRVEDAQREMPS